MRYFEIEKYGVKNVLRVYSTKIDEMVATLRRDGFRVTPISQERAEKMVLKIEENYDKDK